MVVAFLLINTLMGAESSVLDALTKIQGVDEAHVLRGVYDIIARIKTDSVDKLRSITRKIGGNGEITAKLAVLIREE